MRRRRMLTEAPLVLFFLLLGVVTLYPMWHCVAGSLMSYTEYMQKTVLLWPEQVTLEAYDFVF